MQIARHAVFSKCTLDYLDTTVSYTGKMFVELTSKVYLRVVLLLGNLRAYMQTLGLTISAF